MADWLIEQLAADHERRGFSCGQASLDRFIREQAGQYERRGLGRTYVAVPAAERRVVGYYTLAASAVQISSLPKQVAKKLPKHPIPVILLGRLAVDQSMQGQGLGADLLVDACKMVARASDMVGVFALFVEAIDENAKAFYEKFGFTPFPERTSSLFMPMADVREATK